MLEVKSKYRRQGYEIYPKNNLGTVFTAILGFIAYYQFAKDISLTSNIVLLLIIISIVAIYFLVVFFLRIKNLVKEYNALYDAYEQIVDNRDTLKIMIENKNNEIDKLNETCTTMGAQAKMLLHFAYHKDRPSRKVVMESLNIDYEEVQNNEL